MIGLFLRGNSVLGCRLLWEDYMGGIKIMVIGFGDDCVPRFWV